MKREKEFFGEGSRNANFDRKFDLVKRQTGKIPRSRKSEKISYLNNSCNNFFSFLS